MCQLLHHKSRVDTLKGGDICTGHRSDWDEDIRLEVSDTQPVLQDAYEGR